MFCANGRSMCSGYNNEIATHRRVVQLERELLFLSVENQKLAPILEHRTAPISIKKFRKLLHYLPSFASKARDDNMFGAARYLANTLVIRIQETIHANIIDEPMTIIESKQTWRKATFMCKCMDAHNIFDAEIRSFCYSCSYRIPHTNVTHITRCPGCNKQESWEHIEFPCLACQCASVVFRNPFIKRYDTLLNTWLPTSSDIDYSSESNGDNNGLQTPRQQQIYSYTINQDKQIDLLRIRR